MLKKITNIIVIYFISGLVGFCWNPHVSADSTPVLRHAKTSWGAAFNNDQFSDVNAQWSFVKQYSDSFFMHGAYWIGGNDPNKFLYATNLEQMLSPYNKSFYIGLGLDGRSNYSAQGHYGLSKATSDIIKLRNLKDNYGINPSQANIDWLIKPELQMIAAKYPTLSEQQILALLVGSHIYGTQEQFLLTDGTTFNLSEGIFKEYVDNMLKEFPNIKFSFDSTIIYTKNVPIKSWGAGAKGASLGFGYSYSPLEDLGNNIVTVNGNQVSFSFDYADILEGVKDVLGDKMLGYNSDLPYTYIGETPPKNGTYEYGDVLMQKQLSLEKWLHQNGVESTLITNGFYGEVQTDNEWIYIDLGSQKDISSIMMYWKSGEFARDYNIQVSNDASNWSKIATISGSNGENDKISFKKVNARYVKFDGDRRGNPNLGYSIKEFEVYGTTTPTTNLALNKNVKVSAAINSTIGTMAVDGDMNTYWSSNNMTSDQYDKLFHDGVLHYVENYQKVGGRADLYLVESWHSGPYTYFPETKDGSYTDTVKDLIRRIRGIYNDGSAMPLDLSIKMQDESEYVGKKVYQSVPEGVQNIKKSIIDLPLSFDIKISNNSIEEHQGDSRSTPLLRVVQTLDESYQIIYKDSAGKDVTQNILCAEGYDGLFTGGINSGESSIIRVEILPKGNTKFTGDINLSFKVYWNPQDSAEIVRDSIMVNIDSKKDVDVLYSNDFSQPIDSVNWTIENLTQSTGYSIDNGMFVMSNNDPGEVQSGCANLILNNELLQNNKTVMEFKFKQDTLTTSSGAPKDVFCLSYNGFSRTTDASYSREIFRLSGNSIIYNNKSDIASSSSVSVATSIGSLTAPSAWYSVRMMLDLSGFGNIKNYDLTITKEDGTVILTKTNISFDTGGKAVSGLAFKILDAIGGTTAYSNKIYVDDVNIYRPLILYNIPMGSYVYGDSQSFPVGGAMVLNFNYPLDTSTISNIRVLENGATIVAMNPVYLSEEAKTLIILPKTSLKYNAKYMIDLSGVKDNLVGNVAENTWFATESGICDYSADLTSQNEMMFLNLKVQPPLDEKGMKFIIAAESGSVLKEVKTIDSSEMVSLAVFSDNLDYELNYDQESNIDNVKDVAFAHSGQKSFFVDTSKHLKKTFSLNQMPAIFEVWFYDGNPNSKTYSSACITGNGSFCIGILNSLELPIEYYSIKVGDALYLPTSVARTKGWHKFIFDCSFGNELKAYIDGIRVYDGKAVSYINGVWCGNDGSPMPSNYGSEIVNSAYFDDLKVRYALFGAYSLNFSNYDKISTYAWESISSLKPVGNKKLIN